MRLISQVIFTVFLLSSLTFSQKIENSQQKLTKEFLNPTEQDLLQAKYEGLNAFKLLPRGMFDEENNALKLRGAGAYYSFTKKTHSYDKTPQIGLEQNYLMVGFAGADYGFISDLGQISFDSIKYTAETDYLLKYQPPKFEKEIRAEYRKTHNYEINNLHFERRIPVTVGNAYILRAISIDQADTIVSFKIHRQDSDGSLIIFWKPIKNFETPIMLRKPDEVLKKEIENALSKKGFNNVIVSVKNNVVILRGTVQGNNLAEAVMTANEAKPRKVVNQLSYIREN